MKTKIIVSIVILLLAVFLWWWFFVRLTKDKAIKIILESDMSKSEVFLKSADENYLKAWAKAINKGEESFSILDKTYNTKGGKQK